MPTFSPGQAGDHDNLSDDLIMTAPTGGVVRGNIYNIQNAYVVARETKDAAADFLAAFGVQKPIRVKKEAVATAVGQKLYFKSSTKTVTTAATGNTLLGLVAVSAQASGDASVLMGLANISPALT